MTEPETGQRHEDAVLAHLEAARARLAEGASLEAALEAVPADLGAVAPEEVRDEVRDEVRALLEVTTKVEAVATDPSPEFLARLEATLGSAVDQARARRPSRWRRWRTSIGASLAMRAALVSATAVMMLLGTGFVAVEASEDALPGDTLYPVKEARETVERWFARSDAAQLRVQQRQLDRRTDELVRAVDQARDGAVGTLEGAIGRNARELVDRALALEAEGSTTAVPRAREALLAMQQRLRGLAPSARTPEQRQALARVGLFLRAQLARLDAATEAPAGAPSDRPALRDGQPLRDAAPTREAAPQRDTPTPAPTTRPADRRERSAARSRASSASSTVAPR